MNQEFDTEAEAIRALGWNRSPVARVMAVVTYALVTTSPGFRRVSITWAERALLTWARKCVRMNRGKPDADWKPFARYILFVRALVLAKLEPAI